MKGMGSSIVISGWGAISCAGIGAEQSIRNMFTPQGGRTPVKASPGIGTTLSDPVFEITEYHETPGVRRSLSLAITAIHEALERAGLTERDLETVPTGVCFGTTIASQLNNLPLYKRIRNGEAAGLENELREYLQSSPAEYIRRTFHLTGPEICVSNACASGSDVLGIASMWIVSGFCRRVIAVGADDINRVPIAGFHALGVASPEPCRPFDRDRKGLNLGEGSGALILEEASLVRERGMTPRISLAGYGNACDAWHITSPHPEGRGLRTAVESALQSAGITPDRIAFINAHGTSTLANDKCEGTLFPKIFGPDVKYLSTKGWTGHTLGAAGALEAVFTIEMLLRGAVPPSRGFENPDPEIPVPPVSSVLTLDDPEYALSTSLAFGGSNAAVVIGRISG